MKNFLLIFLVPYVTFSQHQIDTSEVKNIRYEWSIDLKTKDTSLFTVLTEYKSGFYHEKIEFLSDSSKFGHFFISKAKNKLLLPKSKIENYVSGIGDGIIRTYYDKYKNPDSIVTSIYEPELKKIVVPIEKSYKRKGKLNYITDLKGKNYYKYNLFGKLIRIEQFRDTVLYVISEFKNDLLISETFPTRKKHRKKYIYKYDKKGRITTKDLDDYYLFRYYYNDFGLRKSEKIFKKRNRTEKYTLYEYSKEGELINKKVFGYRNRLRHEFIYTYNLQ